MIISHANAASTSQFIKEHVKVLVRNNYTTAALAKGNVVCYDVGNSTFHGVGVTQPATANLNMPAGVVETAIGTPGTSVSGTEWGLVLAFGWTDDADVNATTGHDAGDPMSVANGSFALALITAGAESNKGGTRMMFVAGEAYTTGADAGKKVFVALM